MTLPHRWTGEPYIASIGLPNLPTLARGGHRGHAGLQEIYLEFVKTQTFVDFGGTILRYNLGIAQVFRNYPYGIFFSTSIPNI
jgi:hypothetical protein